MRLSVVMPTFNRPDALPRTVAALARQTLDPAEFEVVVVEDAKNEAPVELGSQPFELRVLRGEVPGASSARNVGWRAAKHPVVLFLGDDIVPARDMLARHSKLHDEHPGEDVGVLGHVRWARELKRSAFMVWLDQGIQFDYPSIKGTDAGPGHFYTANVSVKGAALERVGGFDAMRFPFGYEDIDLGLRLFAGGFRLIYDHGASAEHFHQPKLEHWKRRMVTQARAERAWVERYPDERPYFHDLFSEAVRLGERRGRAGQALLPYVPRWVPVLGERVWENADIYFRQQLGKPFLESWAAGE
jgi:GT2 family glycosyltransferase